MGDEHIDTIHSVENLFPIPSEFKGISEDTCDVPVGEDSSTFYALKDHSEILSDSNNDDTSSDDDDFEDIYDNPTPDCVLKSPFSFLIPVTDSDSFFEESDTSLSHSGNSLPEFETVSDHTKETRSGSTTTHANNSLLEYDSFLFEIEPDQGGLISIVISDNSNDPLLELPEFESFHFNLYDDPSFPRPPPEPPDVEICFNFEPDTALINNFNELNEDEYFDPGGGEIVLFQNVADDDSFTFVIRTFLPFLTYLVDSLLLPSTRSEDTVFDPGYPDFEDSCAHGFVRRSFRASISSGTEDNSRSLLQDGRDKSVFIKGFFKEEPRQAIEEAQIVVGFCANLLTKEAQTSHQGNDTLAILRPNAFQKSHSLSRRPFYQQTTLKNRNLNDEVNTTKINSVNTAKGNRVTSVVGEQGINAVKSSACWTWQTVTVDKVNDGEQQLTLTVDGQTIAITEAFVRRHLQLADADGISSLPNTEIFDQLTLMGYVSNDDKLTFQKGPTLTVESQHTPIASPPTS
ncbi:hypothetical protein Tco_1212237 [Tanacetum coccineum]